MPRAVALVLVLLLVAVAAGCGADQPPEEVKLTITGAVAREQALTWTDLSDFGWESLDLRRGGSTRGYNGIRLSTLLGEAEATDAATTLTFVTTQGSTYSLPLAEVLACADCALVTLLGRRLQAAMPGFPDEAWVSDVVELAVG